MDFGDILMNYHDKKEEERKRDLLKKEIKVLKRKNEAVSNREQKLRHDINSGRIASASSYALPRTLHDPLNNSSQTTVAEVQQLVAEAKVKQKLQCLAISTGITAWKQTTDPDTEITFTFDPCILGTFYGPYKLRMKPSKGRISLRGHSLPPSVPVTDLYRQYFDQEEATKHSSASLNPFLSSVMKYLRAFLSRQSQFEELKDQFKEDLREFQSVNHCSAVSFMLDLRDEGHEEAITASIAVNYDKDGERPRPESLRVTLVGQQLTAEDRDAFNEQCKVFYTHRLAEAVLAAF